jgi:hypothetical protein
MGRDRTEAVLIAALILVTVALAGVTVWGLTR